MLVFDRSPASYSREDLQVVINEMRDRSNAEAYAKFVKSEPSACLAVCLCGNGERFQTLSLFSQVDCDCFVAQDPFSPWFTGSALCSGIDELESSIRVAFPHARRYVFAGQSSGGYAAMLLSRRFPNNITLAFAPQTFGDAVMKRSRVSFPPTFNVERSPAILDLRQYFRNFVDFELQSQVYVFASFSEHGNPAEGFYWCDPLHWNRMLEFDDIRVLITSNNIHPLLWRNSRKYAALLSLISNMDDFSLDLHHLVKEATYAGGDV